MASTTPSVASRLLTSVFHAFDGVQVELQGQYSLDRLRAVHKYAAETSLRQAILTIALVPLPCLLTLILLDITPLHSAYLGVYRQTMWFWFRLAFSVGVVGFAITLQLHQSAPTLPLSRLRLAMITIVFGCAGSAEFYMFGVLVGFPTPFVLQLVTLTFVVKLTTALGISWIPTLRRDPEARANLTRYLIAYGSEVGILFCYPIYYYVFSSMSGKGQTAFSLVLPILKIVFKNWVSYGMLHMEDLAPITIVFNIDVFHALFVSPTMQKSKTIGATMTIMAVDVLQSVLEYYQIHDVLTQYTTLAATEKHGSDGVECIVQSALRTVTLSPSVRGHPAIALPRHLRDDPRLASASMNWYSPSSARVRQHRNTVVPIAPAPMDVLSPRLNPVELHELQKVAAVLKLLHMVEFYVLIEYVEVMMAFMYTVYLAVITNHPNHAYYTHLRELTDEQLRSSVYQVAIYAVLELLSFLVFCYVLDRKLRRFSTVRQLAFALSKHWKMAQVVLLLWVIFVVQMSLEHAGTDYTFKFAWLNDINPG